MAEHAEHPKIARDHGDEGGHRGGGGGHAAHGGHGGGGGHEEGHEGAPEWLISFADNVALMMGFFVILLAMNMAKQTAGGIGGEGAMGGHPESDIVDAAIAIRQAFNNPVSIDSADPREAELVERLRLRRQQKQGAREAGTGQGDGIPGKREAVKTIRHGDYFGLGCSVHFEQHSTVLSEEARRDLLSLVDKIKGLSTVVEVRGNVSAAESYKMPDRNMSLAFDRGMAVARLLSENGIEWNRLHVIAQGDNDRVEQAALSPEEHYANQRVEIISTNRAAPGATEASGPSSEATTDTPEAPAVSPSDAHQAPTHP